MSTSTFEDQIAQVGSAEGFRDEVLEGLFSAGRFLPSKYFYDEQGSALFDQICELEEYYPTRIESQIMHSSSDHMAKRIGENVRLVEYGSGSSVKTRLLLDHLDAPAGYVPVDISGDHLVKTANELKSDYPDLHIDPVIADFSETFELPATPDGPARNVIYFPGSTIGNFTEPAAIELLRSMAATAGDDGGLLIGFDLQKDIDVLENAYNDRQGVTAQFNKNVLRRINEELDGDFELDQFEHHAFYNRAAARIEMHLVSRREQEVNIGDERFDFGWGESIVTEYSHKYTIEAFSQMAQQACWESKEVWTDADDYFAVMYLERLGKV